MKMRFSHANFRGCAQNNNYPLMVEVHCLKDLEYVASFDHVCGSFKDNRRSNDGFLGTDVVVMDCDNEHSDDPQQWIQIEDLEDWFGFEISYAVVCSRSHMRQKGKMAARPRFHVYFPVQEIQNPADCAKLKSLIQKEYPFFDKGALDAARFIFGVDTPQVVWHQSMDTIDQKLNSSQTITEGHRNSTLSRYAAQKLVRYGNKKETYEMFMAKAGECNPPLDPQELKTIWSSAIRFYKKVQNNPFYVPPEDYGNGFKYKPDDLSDVGMARVMERHFSDQIRYSKQTKFLYYDGIRWVENDVLARKAIHELTDRQLEEVTPLLSEVQKEYDKRNLGAKFTTRKTLRRGESMTEEEENIIKQLVSLEAYKKTAMMYRDSKHISALLKETGPLVMTDPDQFDADAFLLNTPSGTIDLKTGRVSPHDPQDLITKVTRVSPGDEGIEIWEDHLSKVFLDDQDVILYVQEVCGLLAIGKVVEEKLYIAYGDGSNGKSTFWNTIARVLGSYSGKISTDTLMKTANTNVKNELAELKGKRLIIAGETEHQRKLSPVVIKQVSSKDEVHGEKKYCDPMEFTPTHSVVLYTNHLPVVEDYDWGIWRRLCVIPFNAEFNGKSDIKNYDDYLYEKCGSSILSWIIQGAVRVMQKDGKPTVPKSVEEATNAYREDSDWLADFIAEECMVDPGDRERAGDLWERYRQYCEEHQEYPKQRKVFKEALISKGCTHKKTKDGAFYYGIHLKTDFELEE